VSFVTLQIYKGEMLWGKAGFLVIFKSFLLLTLKVSLGYCFVSGRAMYLDQWSPRQEQRQVGRFLPNIRLSKRRR